MGGHCPWLHGLVTASCPLLALATFGSGHAFCHLRNARKDGAFLSAPSSRLQPSGAAPVVGVHVPPMVMNVGQAHVPSAHNSPPGSPGPLMIAPSVDGPESSPPAASHSSPTIQSLPLSRIGISAPVGAAPSVDQFIDSLQQLLAEPLIAGTPIRRVARRTGPLVPQRSDRLAAKTHL